ncbi:MAG: hypothetical protein IJX65_09375 [Alistipes sp.]|nr:hypothetical protein [Alistipes sp.]
MNNVLKVRVAGQRYRYEVMRVVFKEDNDWLKDPKELMQGGDRNFLRFNDDRLDISNYEYFDHQDAGVAIRHNGEIYYELGNSKGKMPMENVLSALNHPILVAHRNASEEDGLRLTTATVYDKENTVYEYTLELGDNDFDPSLLEVIIILDPIMEEDLHIVEMRYDCKKMNGGVDGLSFGEPIDKNYMLQMPKEYAYALDLPVLERRNILKFDDFVAEENQKDRKKPVSKVRTAKDYSEAAKNGYVKLREDYIHSFIDQHERGVEPDEEE